jgi:colanic acid/amylovoran biosynthesis glycosyltransferase
LRVAIYSGNIPSTTFIENLINGLSKSGFEILLFGKRHKKMNYDGNVRVYATPSGVLRLLPFLMKESLMLLFKDPKLFFKLIKVLRKRKESLTLLLKDAGVLLPVLNHPPDIFHIQWAKTVMQFPEFFELLNCKFVLSLRGAHINYSPLNDKDLADAYRRYFPTMDGFHSVSEALGIEAQKYGADAGVIKVIHSSVKDEILSKEPALYNDQSRLELLSIGRFHWKKGYHYALDAMKALSNEKIDFHYTIVAQGEIPEEIIFLLNDYKLNDKVTIIEGLEHNELIDRLIKSHMLLLSSVEEGIANVVLESMAAGVPVITTDCGGMSEVVIDRINGYIVPAREPGYIAARVREFISISKTEREELVRNARETIQREFTTGKQIREFSAFYNSIAG